MLKKTQPLLLTILLAIFTIVILSLSIRGYSGNPNEVDLNNDRWKANGPFELSPERGRFALTYSLEETKSLQFSNEIGKFAVPDVGVANGRYVSLFAPLLSFITVPGYIIGKFYGASQVGTFAVVAFFAFLNTILIRAIAIRLGAKKIPATIASLIFLFATPAYAYAVNLYQHHLSTFLILFSIFALLKFKKIWALLTVFFLCAVAVPLDYPNLFFLFPIGLYAFGRAFSFEAIKNKISLKINLYRLLTISIMVIPIVFFLWFNQASYGNPFQLSGTLPSARHLLDDNPTDVDTATGLQAISAAKKGDNSRAIAFFQTRNLLEGLYIHFISPDRGMLYYTPVMFFGIVGLIFALRRKAKMTSLFLSIIGANILLYSMWGDPWGGWAFGSRYLIPSYAILSLFIALLLTYLRKRTIFIIIFALIAFYSVGVNTLGAITTSAIPPKVEALSLEKLSGTVQKYNYARNWDFLTSGNSKSFAYSTFLQKYLTTTQFYWILTISICAVLATMTTYYVIAARKEGDKNV